MHTIQKYWPTMLFSSIFVFALLVRIIGLTSAPPAPYWEEVALGYDAYSIKETGKDHHGNFLPLKAVESFGDWKPAGYFYAIIPFLYIFDLGVVAVRMPSVVAGLLIVLGLYKIARFYSVNPYWAAFVAAISPWAIHFSRGGWEANMATAALLWGVYYGKKGLADKKMRAPELICSLLIFGIAVYTYHAARVIAPLLFAGLLIEHFLLQIPFSKRELLSFFQKNGVILLIITCIGTAIIAPFAIDLSSAQVSSRFSETNIFTNQELTLASNQARDLSGNTKLSWLLYHRFVFYFSEVAQTFLSHLSPNFLFVSGDANPRHSPQFIGHLYYLDLVFLLIGLFGFVTYGKKTDFFLGYWLIIALIPASITQPTPHALRALAAMPVFLLVIAKGLTIMESWLKKQAHFWQKFSIGVVALYLVFFGQFWFFYQNVYPVLYAQEWQYGYAELYEKLTFYEQEVENSDFPIYVTRKDGRPAMYYLFYRAVDPRLTQQLGKFVEKDQSEFLSFERYHFVNNLDPNGSYPSGTILASSKEDSLRFSERQAVDFIDEVMGKRGEVIWSIMRIL